MLALFHSGCWHFFIPDVGLSRNQIIEGRKTPGNIVFDGLYLSIVITEGREVLVNFLAEYLPSLEVEFLRFLQKGSSLVQI